MNGIIVYGSFYGTTAYLAGRIAEKFNLKSMKIDAVTAADIENADFIVVGSAIEKFNFHPAVSKFFEQFSDLLSTKKLFLFISSYNPSLIGQMVEKVPEKVRAKLIDSIALGGRIIWKNLSLLDKIIITMMSFVTKQKLKNFDNVNEKRINKFIEKIEKGTSAV